MRISALIRWPWAPRRSSITEITSSTSAGCRMRSARRGRWTPPDMLLATTKSGPSNIDHFACATSTRPEQITYPPNGPHWPNGHIWPKDRIWGVKSPCLGSTSNSMARGFSAEIEMSKRAQGFASGGCTHTPTPSNEDGPPTLMVMLESIWLPLNTVAG